MAGLLGSTSTNSSITNPLGSPTGTAAQINGVEDWNNSSDQSVAGQVQKITAADSPLMQQARTTALQGMNQRGLVNSSLAGTAAQSAVLGAALPMAQQDANTASSIAKYNADTRNNANQFNVQQQNAMASQNLGNANQAYGLNQQTQNDLTKMATQQGYNLATMDKQLAATLSTMTAEQQNNLAKMAAQQGYNLATMDAQQVNDLQKMAAQIQGQKDIVATQTAAAKDVAAIEAQYKSITQGSQSATSIVNNMQSSINAITANTTLDAAAKTAAIADIRANTEESLQLIGALAGDIDLSNYISQIGP